MSSHIDGPRDDPVSVQCMHQSKSWILEGLGHLSCLPFKACRASLIDATKASKQQTSEATEALSLCFTTQAVIAIFNWSRCHCCMHMHAWERKLCRIFVHVSMAASVEAMQQALPRFMHVNTSYKMNLSSRINHSLTPVELSFPLQIVQASLIVQHCSNIAVAKTVTTKQSTMCQYKHL